MGRQYFYCHKSLSLCGLRHHDDKFSELLHRESDTTKNYLNGSCLLIVNIIVVIEASMSRLVMVTSHMEL